MEVKFVYDDGAILTPEIFKMSPDDILSKFRKGINNLASLSLAIGDVNQASVPHLIANAFKNVAAISLEADIKVKQLGSVASAPAKSNAPAPKDAEKAKPAEVKKEEKKEEIDENLGDMFGD